MIYQRLALSIIVLFAATLQSFAFDPIQNKRGQTWGRHLKSCTEIHSRCTASRAVGSSPCERMVPCKAEPKTAPPLRILLGRPSNFTYNALDKKSAWVAAVYEEFLRFKLGSIKRLTIIDQAFVAERLPSYREFDKRISSFAYLNEAKALDATHLVFSEYMRTSANVVEFYIRVIPVDRQKEAIRITREVNVTELNVDFNHCAEKISQALGLDSRNYPPTLAALPLLSHSTRLNKKLGERLLIGEFKAHRAPACANWIAKTARKHPFMYLASFSAARLLEKTHEYYTSATLTQLLERQLSSHIPKLHLLAAQRCRKAHMYDEAEKRLRRIDHIPALQMPIAIERSALRRNEGDLSAEYGIYRKIASMHSIDPHVYVQLGRLAVIRGRMKDALQYADLAAAIIGGVPKKVMMHIGAALVREDQMHYAIDAYRGAVTLPPFDDQGWAELATTQEKLHFDSAAAISWFSLFDKNNYLYRDALLQADSLLRAAGLVMYARQLYQDYLLQHPENPMVSIQLARIEQEAGNFTKAIAHLRVIGGPWRTDPEVIQLIEACENHVETPQPWNPDDRGPFARLWGGFRSLFEPSKPADTHLGYTRAAQPQPSRASSPQPRPATQQASTYKRSRENIAAAPRKTEHTSFSDDEHTKSFVEDDANVETPLDTIAPIITLFGGKKHTIRVGGTYDEPTANAIDDTDGDITHNMGINGKIDVREPGAYTVTYWACDEAGNLAYKTWTLRVLPPRRERLRPLAARRR